MISRRLVEAELLDRLDKDSPQARRSRRDLRRIHRLMRTRGILRAALRGYGTSHREARPLRVLELGAGDGTLLLGFARLVRTCWPAVELTLLDRIDVVADSTIARYAGLRWRATRLNTDVLDWSEGSSAHSGARWDLIIANLFLHHFHEAELVRLLAAIAGRTNAFFACEPRRSRLASLGSVLLGVGVNQVTRADAAVSVRAGFRGQELQSLWSAAQPGWLLQEYPAALFSHCFHARRAAHRTAQGPA